MKKFIQLLLILSTLPFITAMGMSPDSTAIESIPQPEKVLSATFLDQMDVATRCSHVSIEGKTVIDGRMGKGTYLVPLENIRKINFFKKNGELVAEITLRESDDKISLVVKEDLRVFGKTSWGSFQIRLGDLKTMMMDDKNQ